MTDSITALAAVSTFRALGVKPSDPQQTAADAPIQSKEVRSRLLQVAHLAQAARGALAAQTTLCNQIASQGIGTVAPFQTELLSNPKLLEETRLKMEREAKLGGDLQQAVSKSDRTQTELSRALAFLMPQIRPGVDDDDISLPGFDSPMQDPSAMDTSGLVWNSHSDFYAQIGALLGLLQTEWLAKYQDALGKYLEFYNEFSDIMEKLKAEASGDKGDIRIDFKQAYADLKALAAKYGMDANALASFPTRAAAEAFKESLGLPGLVITGPGEGGAFHVKMDLSDVNDIANSMNFSNMYPPTFPNNGIVLDSAKYNSWVSRKDSNMEQIKHVSKVLGEKLSEMTQKFDNIVKILSSTIDKITEADMSFVHGL